MGEKVDARTRWGYTPLLIATGHGNLDTVNVLLKQGANPNAIDYQGRTPLFNTCNVEIMQALIANGADVNARNRVRQTPVHEVLRCKIDDKLLQILLLAGADANATDELGLTPLHMAMGYSDVEVARMLLEHGADVNAENVQGLTPRDIAVVLGKQDLVNFLDSHGGKSLKYTQTQTGKVRVYKGKYYQNDGICNLKENFERNVGFNRIRYTIGWNGAPGSLGGALTFRTFAYPEGMFFAEPGHEYVVDSYGSTAPTNAYGEVIDKSTQKVVGLLY